LQKQQNTSTKFTHKAEIVNLLFPEQKTATCKKAQISLYCLQTKCNNITTSTKTHKPKQKLLLFACKNHRNLEL
jgi:hypothetical protein